jgi:D-alanine-D-alanine ligase
MNPHASSYPMTLAVLAGGYSAEAAVSLRSAETVMAHIDRSRFQPYLVRIERGGWWAEGPEGEVLPIDRRDFTATTPDGPLFFDGVFIMVHGSPGEDGKLQGYFELLGIPFSTGGSRSMALTFHKGWTTAMLRNAGIPVARSVELFPHEPVDPAALTAQLGLPCFVKPNEAGSSIGVHRVDTPEALAPAIAAAFAAEPGTVLVEALLPGREFTVGVLPPAHPAAAPTPLPVTEIISFNAFFDYAAKYEGASREVTPAEIPEAWAAKMQALAGQIYRLLHCRGVIRVDMMVAPDGLPHVIEVNTVPGFSAASIIPQQAAAAGISTTDLITRILEATLLPT